MAEVFDHGNPEDVKRFREEQNKLALQAGEDLRKILTAYGGRSFFWDLLSECGVYGSTHRGELTHETSFLEGKRKMGLWIMERMFTVDPNAYTLMRSEAEARTRARALEKGMDQDG